MKKYKLLKRFQLNRETIRRLDDPNLERAAGGTTGAGPTCTSNTSEACIVGTECECPTWTCC